MADITIVLYCCNIGLRVGAKSASTMALPYKVGNALSLICPPLKYHLFRLSSNFTGNIREFLKRDIVCNSLQLFAGITAEISAGNCGRPLET